MATTPPEMKILLEDDHLLALVKPAGLATANAARGVESLYTIVKRRHPFVGIVSRLDLPVSGVVVLAKTPAAAADLSRQFRERSVAKGYGAVVEGRFPAPLSAWVDWTDTMVRQNEEGEDEPEQEAHVRARVTRRAGEVSLVELEPSTGRRHQLRVQLSQRRCPIVGDRLYGARLPFPGGIALHARSLAIDHPDSGGRLVFEAPWPAAWRERFPALFGRG